MSPYLLKRSQIKMFESLAMLLVFFFLVAIGLKFYGSYQLNQLKDMQNEFNTFDSVKMSILLANLPELKCSIQNVQGGACIDLYKVKAWSNQYANEPARSYYFNLFGHATVTLEQIEPPIADPVWVMHNSTPNGNYSSHLTPMPVSIWDPTTRRHNFGVLYVQVHTP